MNTMGGAEAVDLPEETRSMTHRNSPRPLPEDSAWSNVSKMMAILSPTSLPKPALPTLTKWVHCYRADGAKASEDRTSAPARRPSRPPIRSRTHRRLAARAQMVGLLHRPRASAAAATTTASGPSDAGWNGSGSPPPATLSTRPWGDNCEPGRSSSVFPGDMLHLDVKKVGQIPTAADGDSSTAAHRSRPRLSAGGEREGQCGGCGGAAEKDRTSHDRRIARPAPARHSAPRCFGSPV